MALLWAGCVILALLTAGILLLHHFWPFTQDAVKRELGNAASAHVSFDSFHYKYFPPGCVAEGVVFTRANASSPLITMRRLRISSSFFGLLHHRVSLIRAEGAHVTWQKDGSTSDASDSQSSANPTVIDRLVADDAVLEIPRKSESKAVVFTFHKFEVTNLRGPGRSSFTADFENPFPKGNLHVSGHFGPWNNPDPKKTELDGSYKLEKADLAVFHSIGGLVSSTGRFSGMFDHLTVQGEASIPNLEVTKTQHGLPLTTDFTALVDGHSGDVFLPRVKARFGRDELDVSGSIARRKDGKRTADLDLVCNKGRIEDTFYPFIHSPKSALVGELKFRMHVTIPPGKEKFEQKLGLTSTFTIEDARFTHEQTQVSLSKIAEKPHQQDPNTLAPARFHGQVAVQDGVARFSALRVVDQDADAVFHGDYSLTDEHVNMRGQLKTAASLTKATHGIKSVFAKVIEPFFKKKPHETVVPVKIGGTYSHPQFGLDLSKKM